MKVAIVGSRDFPNMELVRDYVRKLPTGTVVVSGGARGVDTVAESEARLRGLTVDVFQADWDGLGKRAGFVRNAKIVEAADCVTAFWDGVSRGTEHTIGLAKKAGKITVVVSADGFAE